MSLFERWLTLWVALCILVGLVLGNLMPGLFTALAGLEYASVNLVVAVLIWAMVYPMMIAIDFGSLKDVGRRPKGLIITLVINWLIKPFTMAALGVLFFQHLFAGLIDGDKAPEYVAGLILLGAAPCPAMVFVWSQMTKGDANYTLVQVSLNDLIMVVAFAPIVAFLLGVTDIVVPWETLILSTVLYVVIPLVAGAITRSAPRCSRQSVKPPVDAPTSSALRPATSRPIRSRAFSSFVPPRETCRRPSSTASSTSLATSCPGFAARAPAVPRRTSPAMTDAAAREREGNRPRRASRVSRRTFSAVIRRRTVLAGGRM